MGRDEKMFLCEIALYECMSLRLLKEAISLTSEMCPISTKGCCRISEIKSV